MSRPAYTLNHTRVLLGVEDALSALLSNGRYTVSDLKMTVADPLLVTFKPDKGFDLPGCIAIGLVHGAEWPINHRFVVIEVRFRYAVNIRGLKVPDTAWTLWDSEISKVIAKDDLFAAMDAATKRSAKKWPAPPGRHVALNYIRQACPPPSPVTPKPPGRGFRKITRIVKMFLFNL